MSEEGGVKIRAARADDFDAVYPLLQQLNDTRIGREVWQRLFQPLWNGAVEPGYVIDHGSNIVGFIGTLYSERSIGGEVVRLCNLTSWIVLPEYRQQSVMMLMSLLRDKTLTLTSLTSSPEAYAVYKKLGFADLEASARVVYRFPVPGCRRYQLAWADTAREQLCAADRVLYDHHSGLDVEQCLVSGPGGNCFLVLERKRGRAHIHHISNPAWFCQHLSRLRYRLLRSMGVRSLQVDERFVQGQSLVPSRRKIFDQAKQFRSKNLQAQDIDGLYSELVVLATP